MALICSITAGTSISSKIIGISSSFLEVKLNDRAATNSSWKYFDETEFFVKSERNTSASLKALDIIETKSCPAESKLQKSERFL